MNFTNTSTSVVSSLYPLAIELAGLVGGGGAALLLAAGVAFAYLRGLTEVRRRRARRRARTPLEEAADVLEALDLSEEVERCDIPRASVKSI